MYGDPIVALWTGPWSRASIEAWTTEMVERWSADGVGKWVAHDRLNGSLVGRGGFTRFDLDGQAVLELGWVIRDALTGRGSATEIGRRSAGPRLSSRTYRSSPSLRCTTFCRRR